MALFFSTSILFSAAPDISSAEDVTISTHMLQKIDLRGAFEAVYTIALEQGTLHQLPTSFLNCLASLRAGNDRIKCREFVEALAFVLETLVVLRDVEKRYMCVRPHCCCEERFRRLEEDLLEIFVDFGDRIETLEKICATITGATR